MSGQGFARPVVFRRQKDSSVQTVKHPLRLHVFSLLGSFTPTKDSCSAAAPRDSKGETASSRGRRWQPETEEESNVM